MTFFRRPGKAMTAQQTVTIILLGVVPGACSLATGASSYDETSHCTGPACGVCPAGQLWDTTSEICVSAAELCVRQGKRWDAELQSCWGADQCPAGLRWYASGNACVPSCSEGSSDCGPTCCASGQFCVAEKSGSQRCSACEKVDYECGPACCPNGLTCVNAAIGVCGAAFGVAGQSCAVGLDCAGTSCCESLAVPGGTVPQGSPDSDTLAREDEKPERPVTVSSYSLDKYEVTVGRFRTFVQKFDYAKGLPEGAGVNVNIRDSGWRAQWNKELPQSQQEQVSGLQSCGTSPEYVTWTMADDTLPMNCATWFEAFAFCAWDGGRLPTEAEWEYVAAGGDENRAYPWGAQLPSDDLAVCECNYDGTTGCGAGDIAPVGKKPLGAGRWGHLDLAGNMWEWVFDVYDVYPDDAREDYADPSVSATLSRVLRGASWGNGGDAVDYLRAASRSNTHPALRERNIGFRCARNL